MRYPECRAARLVAFLVGGSSLTPAQQFTSSLLVGAHSLPEMLVTADLNGDGSSELIVAGLANLGTSGWIEVFSLLPNGSWGSFCAFATGRVNGMVVADVTGDDRPELLVSNGVLNPSLARLDTYSFTATLQRTLLSSQQGIWGTCWIRGDADDRPDLFAIRPFDVGFARHLGNGVFASLVYTTFPTSSLAEKVGDFDGDGLADIARLVQSPLRLDVWRGDGFGGFLPPVSTPLPAALPGGPGAFLTGDLNRDGLPDLVIDRTIALASGAGTFTFVPLPAAVWPLAVGDFDGDGLPDILSGNVLGRIEVYRQQPGMTFVTNGAWAGGTNNAAIFVLDANQDGHLDYAILNTQTGGPVIGEVLTSVRPHAIPAVWPYGVGTWGCRGHAGLSANADPTLGLSSFGIIAANLPPRAPGVLLAFVGSMWPAPVQPFGLGFTLHLPWSLAMTLPFSADLQGQAHLAAPIPVTGFQVQVQALWLAPNGDGDCSASPLGVITSNALQIAAH